MSDDKLGNLLSNLETANGGSAVLAPGATVTFQVTTTVPVQNAGTTYTNTVTVDGQDDEHDAADGNAAGDGELHRRGVPSISVTKQASVTSVEEGGVGNQSVTYTYTIKNTNGSSTDPVTLSSLSDDKLGNLLLAIWRRPAAAA